MSDTPETDALYKNDHQPNLMAHARRLERERNNARAIISELVDIMECLVEFIDDYDLDDGQILLAIAETAIEEWKEVK
jgi:hypothetical protein